MGNIMKIIKNPLLLFQTLGYRGFFNWMSDETYLKIAYYARMHKKLDLNNPETFNEKLQWLKIYDRKPIYTTMVDKYAVKEYVSNLIGDEYIISTLGVWERFDDINFDTLPNSFVLKCTHDSGGLIICSDKSKLNIKAARKKINRSLKKNFYWQGREWPYKDVKPRILAEEYMVDESGYELKDYKLFCFDGFAKAMFIASDRQLPDEETKFDFYDMNFKHLPFTNGHPNSNIEIKRPASFEKMKRLAEKLSEGIPQVRVDFYDINGQVYFGELTLSHWSSMTAFDPEEWDQKLGEWIKLPDIVGGYLIANSGYILWLHVREDNLPVYKFFCFDGEPRVIQVIQNDKQKNECIDYFDIEWNMLNFRQNFQNSQIPLKRPRCLNEMIDTVRILAKEKMGFIRVDLYTINEKIFFSEYTFFSDGGFERFYPETWDSELGKLINLSRDEKLS